MCMHRTPPVHFSVALFFLACVTAPDLTQTVAEISANDLRRHITALASEAMDGRLTGTEGERRATDYVAAVFASLGLEPAGDKGTFFQPFEFTAGVSLGTANRLVLHKDVTHGTQE